MIKRHTEDSVKLLTAGEVADRLRVSIRTVERWVTEGTLTAHYPGGPGPGRTRRFREDDVTALLHKETRP